MVKQIKEKNHEIYSLMQELLPQDQLNQMYFYPDKARFSQLMTYPLIRHLLNLIWKILLQF